MRRKDKLVTDVNLLHEVINKAEVCRLGLVEGTKPYIIPLSFGFDGTYLYIHSAPKGKKVDILSHNPRVCVEFEQNIGILKSEKPCNWSVRYFTVIGNGNAELVEDCNEKNYGLNQIVRHYDPEAPVYAFTEQDLSAVLVYKIKFEEIAGKISGMTRVNT